MKIPLILAQEPIAQPARRSAGGGLGVGQGEALLAESLSGISRSFGQLAHVQRMREEKAAADQRTQALQAFDAETWTALDVGAKALRVQQAEANDPDEYQRITATGFRDLHQAAQQQAGADPERRALVEKRYQQILRSEADTFAAGLVTRRHAKSVVSLGQLEERTREEILRTTDPEALHRLNGEFRLAVEEAPYLKADEKQRMTRAFQERMKTDWLALQAMNDPLGFSALALRAGGQFDSLALERAGNIAEKELKARQERNKQMNEEIGWEIEQGFWREAQKGTLERDRLDRVADWLKWDKPKVDRLWRTQLGLKTASPDAEALLAAAMEPINKVDPTMRDVDRAWDNLTALAGDVPRQSGEYQRQVSRLRTLRDAITGRGNVEEHRQRAQAMRRIDILLDKHIRKSRQPRYAQQLAKWREAVMLRPAGELPGFLTEIEKDLMDAAKGGAAVEQDIDGLKGLRK